MGKSGTVARRVPPLGLLHGKVDASGRKLNRQEAKFAKEARDEGSETGFHASVSRVPSDWLGGESESTPGNSDDRLPFGSHGLGKVK